VLSPNAKPSSTATEKAPKAPAAAAPAAAPKASGRKLLQGWQWGMEAGPTAEMDAAQQNIANAVSGDESVAAAANASRLGAEELSIPGDYAQVENGLDPL